VDCGVCDTPQLWRGAAGLCVRVRACAGAAEYLYTYIHARPYMVQWLKIDDALRGQPGTEFCHRDICMSGSVHIQSQTVYIQRGHEHTRTENGSTSGFGSLRGAPLNISRCLGGSRRRDPTAALRLRVDPIIESLSLHCMY